MRRPTHLQRGEGDIRCMRIETETPSLLTLAGVRNVASAAMTRVSQRIPRGERTPMQIKAATMGDLQSPFNKEANRSSTGW